MTGVRFIPNPAGIAAIGVSEGVAHALEIRGDEVVTEAQAIAPRQTGAYADSIEVELVAEEGKVRARVIAKDFKAAWIEFGTAIWPGYGTLRAAAEAAGLVLSGGED